MKAHLFDKNGDYLCTKVLNNQGEVIIVPHISFDKAWQERRFVFFAAIDSDTKIFLEEDDQITLDTGAGLCQN